MMKANDKRERATCGSLRTAVFAVLGIMMCVMLCLMFTVAASADTGEGMTSQDAYVAKITRSGTEYYYESRDAALAAAKTNDVVTLLADAVETTAYTCNINHLTIDLNGHDVGKLIFKDLTIVKDSSTTAGGEIDVAIYGGANVGIDCNPRTKLSITCAEESSLPVEVVSGQIVYFRGIETEDKAQEKSLFSIIAAGWMMSNSAGPIDAATLKNIYEYSGPEPILVTECTYNIVDESTMTCKYCGETYNLILREPDGQLLGFDEIDDALTEIGSREDCTLTFCDGGNYGIGRPVKLTVNVKSGCGVSWLEIMEGADVTFISGASGSGYEGTITYARVQPESKLTIESGRVGEIASNGGELYIKGGSIGKLTAGNNTPLVSLSGGICSEIILSNGLTLGDIIADGYVIKNEYGWYSEELTYVSSASGILAVEKSPFSYLNITGTTNLVYGSGILLDAVAEVKEISGYELSYSWDQFIGGSWNQIFSPSKSSLLNITNPDAGEYLFRCNATLKYSTSGGDSTYTRQREIAVTVSPYELSNTSATIEVGRLVWNGGNEITAEPTVKRKNGVALNSANDFTVEGNIQRDVGTYTLTVTGKGNYSGSATKEWSIIAAEASYNLMGAPTVYYEKLADAVAASNADPAGWPVIRLHTDVTIDSTLSFTETATLDLNGHILEMAGSGSVINASNKFDVMDSAPNSVHADVTLPNGGVITSSGSGATTGGGIYASSDFTFLAGTIYGCYASSDGGGIWASGMLTIHPGAAIRGCRADGAGGGIYAESDGVTIHGEISDCTAKESGGVYVTDGVLTLTGKIKGCRSTLSGQAITSLGMKNTDVVVIGDNAVIDDCLPDMGENRPSIYAYNLTLMDCEIKRSSYILVGTKLTANGGVVDCPVEVNGLGGIVQTAGESNRQTKFMQRVQCTQGKVTAGQYHMGISELNIPNTCYTITYMNGDSVYAIQVVENGHSTVSPGAPFSVNTFIGWYNGDVIYDFGSAVTENMTLTARWVVSEAEIDRITTRLSGWIDDNGARIDDMMNDISALELALRGEYISADEELMEQVTELISRAKEAVAEKASADLAQARGELEQAIDTKAGADELRDAIQTLNQAISTAKTVAEEYTDEAVNGLGTELAEAKQSLETAIDDIEARLDSAVAALESKDGELSGKISALESALGDAQALISAHGTRLEELEASISDARGALQKSIDELSGRLDDAEGSISSLKRGTVIAIVCVATVLVLADATMVVLALIWKKKKGL